MADPETWRRALADWVRLGEAYLAGRRPRQAFDAAGLEDLLAERGRLLEILGQPMPEGLDLGDLPERARELDLELVRLAGDELERRRDELTELGRLRSALKGYRGPDRAQQGRARTSRFIDTRS